MQGGNDLKKLTILILISFALLTGCNQKKTMIEINYKTFDKMNANKESYILFIGSKSCTHCQAFKPIVEKVLTQYKDLDIYYVDLEAFEEEEIVKLSNVIKYDGTPTIAFIINGEEKSSYNRVEGETSKEKLIQKLRQNGYIK